MVACQHYPEVSTLMDKGNSNILVNAVCEQLYALFGNSTSEFQEARTAVHLLMDNLKEFEIPSTFVSDSLFNEFALNKIHETLSTLNERELRRKKDGVYYTLPDVTNFITYNSFIKYLYKDFELVLPQSNIESILKNLNNLQIDALLQASVFDPTCGAGEFLISAVSAKLSLCNEDTDDETILRIAASIYGNDISCDSIYISRVRLFFTILPFITSTKNFSELASIIKFNLSCEDFINVNLSIFRKFDIIIGNPPYVEYRALEYEPNEKLGNTYANVLSNSCKLLDDSAVMGYIVPISFVATKRMYKIRNIIDSNFDNIVLLNYADRPDCLFSGVHQKLTIIIASKNNSYKGYYSSSYNYWYKQERNDLFNRTDLVKIIPNLELGFPKVGTEIEFSIFNKCCADIFDRNLYDSSVNVEPTKHNSVYLNMRNCFWIKAFSFNPGSSEYKRFSYNLDYIDFIRCILNSSLFFFFWTTVSDCWHITSKELMMFKLPNIIGDKSIFSNLFSKLEKRLEETKVYVGTKQTDYEYKHKLCKDIIDEIDDAIASSFLLSKEEISYIKNYILKYRLNDGV